MRFINRQVEFPLQRWTVKGAHTGRRDCYENPGSAAYTPQNGPNHLASELALRCCAASGGAK